MDKILAPIKQRILQFIEFNGFNKNSFFDKLEVSASNFRSKSLYSEVGGDVIAKISSQYPDVNIEWLVTGNGSMIKHNNRVEDNINADINRLDDRPINFNNLREKLLSRLQNIEFSNNNLNNIDNNLIETFLFNSHERENFSKMVSRMYEEDENNKDQLNKKNITENKDNCAMNEGSNIDNKILSITDESILIKRLKNKIIDLQDQLLIAHKEINKLLKEKI